MRELTLLFGATFKNVRECNSKKMTFCAVGFSCKCCVKSFVKNRSFRQDTVAQLNNAPLPRSGSGKKRRSGMLSIKILETLHGY